mmetsp:Transcript_15805/g.45049  ORF Transcript_15805/g.45049 Transcript_15805/m.45049 type:complete len:358 (+) Transcript_15805:914-1987(+)
MHICRFAAWLCSCRGAGSLSRCVVATSYSSPANAASLDGGTPVGSKRREASPLLVPSLSRLSVGSAILGEGVILACISILVFPNVHIGASRVIRWCCLLLTAAADATNIGGAEAFSNTLDGRPILQGAPIFFDPTFSKGAIGSAEVELVIVQAVVVGLVVPARGRIGARSFAGRRPILVSAIAPIGIFAIFVHHFAPRHGVPVRGTARRRATVPHLLARATTECVSLQVTLVVRGDDTAATATCAACLERTLAILVGEACYSAPLFCVPTDAWLAGRIAPSEFGVDITTVAVLVLPRFVVRAMFRHVAPAATATTSLGCGQSAHAGEGREVSEVVFVPVRPVPTVWCAPLQRCILGA